MRIVSVIFLTFILPQISVANGFVGNGGEGIFVGKQLILRDLYETMKPPQDFYIGSKADPQIVSGVEEIAFPEQLSVDRLLLAKKLTDIEALEPGLGFIILYAFSFYRFIPTEFDIPLARDTVDSLSDYPKRIQVGLRLNYDLIVSRKRFLQMDSLNRVAFLLHEVIYGMSRVYCGNNRCAQNSMPIRAIVGRLFYPPHQIDRSYLEYLEKKLNILPKGEYCKKSEIEINLQVSEGAFIEDKPAGSKEYSRNVKSKYKDWYGSAEQICEELSNYDYSSKSNTNIRLDVEVGRLVLVGGFYSVFVNLGGTVVQDVTELKWVSEKINLSLENRDKGQCLESLRNSVDKKFTSLANFRPGHGVDFDKYCRKH